MATRSDFEGPGALNALVSTRVADTLASDTLFATSYTRDSLSRITQLVERVAGVTQTIGFTYDSVGRLSAVARNGVTTASYTYDLNGNRATKTTSGGVATATVDDQDRLTSYGGATYAYTNNGELTRKIVGTDTTLYTYDALGNLTDVELPDGTAIGYLIDAQNRRIGKTVNDTLVRAWLYQGQLTPVAELDGQGTVVSRFVYATGVNVPDYLVRGDSTYRLIKDHLGSVRLVVNVASGTVAQRLAYDEFGIETENTNPAWQPFGYAGGLTDAQTGLVRFGARDYDPASGRWTAKDPIGFAGGATSLYEYAANDPVTFSDPSGLEIALQAHSVAGSVYFHALIRITPQDQERWKDHPLFKSNVDENGRVFMTLGAGPVGFKLRSDPNRGTDTVPHSWSTILTLPSGKPCPDENAMIATLIALDAAYADDVWYGAQGTSNSVSF